MVGRGFQHGAIGQTGEPVVGVARAYAALGVWMLIWGNRLAGCRIVGRWLPGAMRSATA
jgi:hypothetical protein